MMKKILFINAIILCAALLVAEESSAETNVCSGDTVVLVLNGYKQGSTLWLESPDLHTWKTASGTSHKDSLVIRATATLYYCAIVTNGTCSPFYSDTVLIIVHPIPPTAKPASEIIPVSFIANWNIVAGTTTYYLDVATDSSFTPTSFVSGFKNIQVNNRQTLYPVTGLTCERTYYYRVRAYDDNCGITSGNSNIIIVTTPACPVYCTHRSTCDGKISDTRDNKIYKTVQIATQCWMAENLNVGIAIQGEIPQTPGVIEKYCYGYSRANNDSSKCATYGGLYQWHEMMGAGVSDSIAPGPQGICPAGWHIPTDDEWTCLELNLGMPKTHAISHGGRGTDQGGKLKDTTTVHWISPNKGATNSSGFTALPGGKHWLVFPLDKFLFQGGYGYWWSATEYKPGNAWLRQLRSDDAFVSRIYDATVSGDSELPGVDAFSVRCVKD